MSVSFLTRALTGVALGISVLLAATPAAAHDQLLESVPASGQALATAPKEVSLTFSANVIALGTVIEVTDPAGTNWVNGDPVASGPTVTAALKSGIPENSYTMKWRVVSSDGHPISGATPFTVGTVPAASSNPASQSSAPQETSAGADPWAPGGLARLILVAGIGALIGIALLTAGIFLGRRFRNGPSDRQKQEHHKDNSSDTGQTDDKNT